MTTPLLEIRDQSALLRELIESLKQAEGACSQLIHQLQDPRFVFMRDAINVTTSGCLKLATFEARKQVFVKPA